MGYPNMDFFVREVRECLSGDMVVVRCVFHLLGNLCALLTSTYGSLGSCGGLGDVQVGTVIVPEASVAITRNYDYNFVSDGHAPSAEAYHISKPVITHSPGFPSPNVRCSPPFVSVRRIPSYARRWVSLCPSSAFVLLTPIRQVAASLRASASNGDHVRDKTVNASADSFYSSQGRITSFDDRNEDLFERLQMVVPKLATLEVRS